MKAVSSKSAEAVGRHLSEEEMIAFYQGQLPEAEREAGRAHLAYCPECLQLWRDARDFCAPAEEGEVEAGEFEARREWKELWSRIQTDPQTAATTSSQIAQRSSAFASRTALALAAGIALILGLGTVTLFWQQERRERIQAQEAAARMQTERQDLLAQVTQLVQASRTQPQIEEQLKQERAKNQELQARLDESSQPQTNNSIFELQLPGSNTRSNDQDIKPAPEISVPAYAKSWVLRITPDKPEEFPGYVLKISDRQNVTKWESNRLKLDQSQSLVATFPSAFLNKGRYQLLVYGWNGSGLKLLGKYDLKLN
jgi:anti-sigma factor RsiW